ncbi:hypothetical protein GCM10010345_69690 [Streptomyces canarius]|uniref:Uncharacterized protein n=1 Tax=Streptomyces canarius TaxID=285453 RepID=A0ABQ3D2F2_9ACTN|nr:hypothetical protein GCM10010345_69690 [Streptomyces canarius]
MPGQVGCAVPSVASSHASVSPMVKTRQLAVVTAVRMADRVVSRARSISAGRAKPSGSIAGRYGSA